MTPRRPLARRAKEKGLPGAAARSFPVVGIGASAGGLDACSQLLAAVPPDTGMAFVVIQHLDPTHVSALPESLSKATDMPVAQVRHHGHVEPNHVYVIPPDADVTVEGGVFVLTERVVKGRALHLPIDTFFQSLAVERGARAIGVVLSGTASDGTEGLRAIKAAGGITLAQDPASAKFDSMPRSAIAAGVVDRELPIADIGRELFRLSGHAYVSDSHSIPGPDHDKISPAIFELVRKAVGTDFSEYKSPTFQRRLARRMALRHARTPADYLAILETEPEEVVRLYEDVLIHVTSFFRDPAVFEHLKSTVFAALLKQRSDDQPLRFWVAGCSTGEEVYSVAIALLEASDAAGVMVPMQIFGSDISERAIEKARLGVFADSAMKDVSDARRGRFFTKVDGGYRIDKKVRDACIFVRHDLARDPPFSKLDFISCRNVLIYFDQTLQQRVLPIFHYALKRGGFLLLGHNENIAGFASLFASYDSSSKVFQRTSAASALRFAPRTEVHPASPVQMRRSLAGGTPQSIDMTAQIDRLLLTRYAPPAVLINERLQILQFCGDVGEHLRPAPGEPQNSITKMARPGLTETIRDGVALAKRRKRAVTIPEVATGSSRHPSICDLTVVPFSDASKDDEQLSLVLFETVSAAKRVATKKTKAPAAKTERVLRLEHELGETQDYLQSVVNQHERNSGELNSANEELISGNEELQSLNEELETAKEELQSTNEELITVNDELHVRNREAAELNADLMNLLSTVDVPLLILDKQQRIRRFTPKASRLLNIRAGDVGRPLDDIRSSLQLDDVKTRFADVIANDVMHEWEVQDRDGVWYRMQIRPFHTTDNRVDGATLSLVSIDALKRSLGEAQRANTEAARANLAKDEFLAMLSHEMRTPLFSILLQAELLTAGLDDVDRVKRAGEAIERGAMIQVRLIDDLLDVSRIVSGKLLIESNAVDLAPVTDAALEVVTGLAARKHITLDVHVDRTLGTVLGDAVRLQQIVTNLLTNAIKFSHEGSTIGCNLAATGTTARLQITDTGVGIAPEFLGSVFDRFSQEEGGAAQHQGGLGLGLAIVKHLVEAHRGKVAARSAGRGRGATFVVDLPLMPTAHLELQHAPDLSTTVTRFDQS